MIGRTRVAPTPGIGVGTPGSAVIRTTAVLLALSMGCGEPSPDWTGTRDSVGGIEVVRNPQTPLLDSASVGVREVWRQSGRSMESPWAQPTAVEFAGGKVYVLDMQGHRVHGLGAENGRSLLALGREGDGPGEFRRPFGVEVVGDRIVVGDRGGPGVDLFSMGGAYLRSLRLGFQPFFMESLPDDRVWVTGLAGGTSTEQILHLDGETRAFPAADTSVVDVELEFSSCPRWGPSRVGLVRGHCRRLAYQLLAPSGASVAEVHVDRPPVRASEAELDTFRRRIRRSVADVLPPSEARAFVDERVAEARVKAVYGRVRGDRASGFVFVQEQNPPALGGGPATLHVFSADGRYLARLPFRRPWRDFSVDDGRLFALTIEPATGLADLARYDLVVPSIPSP